MFEDFYSGKRVLVTGHTGFKGGWLSLWLHKLGAAVGGYALPPADKPNFNELLPAGLFQANFLADIRDATALRKALEAFRPELIFHLAAQPLVRLSYEQPEETFATNAFGTLNLLEAVRAVRLPAALVLATTDKCYANHEWTWAYRENDPLGGRDPYSASKACAEIIIHCWRESFFTASSGLGPVASARAGNVIGGGDYARDRIVPDAIRALLARKPLVVRNPDATRPWQHVLDSLHGYLLLGRKLAAQGCASPLASAFNFGPGPGSCYSVREVAGRIFKILPGRWESPPQAGQPHEAAKLNLAIDKAVTLLGWRPVWPFEQAVEKTGAWYRERHFTDSPDMAAYSLSQIAEFERDALRQ